MRKGKETKGNERRGKKKENDLPRIVSGSNPSTSIFIIATLGASLNALKKGEKCEKKEVKDTRIKKRRRKEKKRIQGRNTSHLKEGKRR